MYMTGNSLQMFSIMMVFMLFKTPITAILSIQNTFARFESESNRDKIMLAKLAFIGCNFLALALGVYKVNAMGLLPYVSRLPRLGPSSNHLLRTTRSDWLAWEYARMPLERGLPA
jgi:hypothetical protein